MALTEHQKKRIRVYEYLIIRIDRKRDLYTVDDFLCSIKRNQYYLLMIRIRNLEFKIKQLKNGNPENGLAIEFEHETHGD